MNRRSPCPVACTLDLIGDKWTLLVVRDLAHGKSLFKEFRESPEGIATNILSDRLSRLVDAGLAERTEQKGRAGRASYSLTRKGKSLLPILRSLAEWGLKNIPDTEIRIGSRKN